MHEATATNEESIPHGVPPTFHSIVSGKIALVGILFAVCTIVAFVLAPALVRLEAGTKLVALDSLDYAVFSFRMNIIRTGVLLSVWLLVPFFDRVAEFFNSRGRAAYTVGALVAACGFLSVFIIHFGNRQFGGWDFSILIDSGWRQILGQRPYTDFISTNPPSFNLGIKYAFLLFGVNWNAQLYFTAIFASASFLWAYWLLWRLIGSRLAAFCMAFAIECAVALPLCFWWFNSSVSITATLFFLSCLLYAQQPNSRAAQVSYPSTLAVLVLMKPNIAGLAAICGIIFLLVWMRHRRRPILLTVGAAGATFLIMYFSRISIPAMIASYRGGIEHAVARRYGLVGMTRLDKLELLGWTLMVAAPLFSLLLPTWKQLRTRQWRTVASYLFLATPLPIALYGMATNSEIKEVECGMLLAAGAVIAFGLRLSSLNLRRFYIAMVFTVAVSGIYMGATRIRVLGIGPHQFFEWRDGNVPVANKFFKDTYASPAMRNVIQQVEAAKSRNKGPFFFGPRIEFTYAVVGVPSPRHLPLYWQPGTSFARRDEQTMIELWKQHNFNTLIFLKGDYTFYPAALLSTINSEYQKDNSYPDITVYHARQ